MSSHTDSGLHEYEDNFLRFQNNDYSEYMDRSPHTSYTASPILGGNTSTSTVYEQAPVTNEVILEEITTTTPRTTLPPFEHPKSFRESQLRSPHESSRSNGSGQPRRWRLVPHSCTCPVHGSPANSARSHSVQHHTRECEAGHAYDGYSGMHHHGNHSEYEDRELRSTYNINSNYVRSRPYADELEKLKGSVSQLDSELSYARQNRSSFRKSARDQAETEVTKKTMEAEFKGLHGKLSEQREVLMKRHELELASKDQERERLEAHLAECQHRLAEANKKAESATEAKRKLKEQLNDAIEVMEQESDRANANEAMRRMLDQEVAVRIKVQNELQKMQKTVEPLFTDLESLKSQLDSKNRELEGVLGMKHSTEGEFTQEREQWKMRLDSKEVECQELRNQMSLSVAQLETEREHHQKVIQEKEQNVAYLQERLHSLEKLHVDAEQVWMSGEQDIAREKARLEEEVRELKKKLEQAEQRVEQAEKERVKAEQELQKTLEDLEEIKNLYAQESNARQALEYELEDIKSGHESLQTRLASSEDTLREAEQELKELKLKYHEEKLCWDEAAVDRDIDLERIKMKLEQEREELAVERDEALKERDQAFQERDLALKGRDEAVLDKEQVMYYRDESTRERNEIQKQRDGATMERDEALLERDTARKERDEALDKCKALQELGQALMEQDELLKERDDALRAREEALQRSNQVSAERDEILQQRDKIAKERDALLAEMEQLNGLIKDQEGIIDGLQKRLAVAEEDLDRVNASQPPSDHELKVLELQRELEETRNQFEEEKEKLKVEAEIREKRLQQGIIMLNAKLKSATPPSPGQALLPEASSSLRTQLEEETRLKTEAVEKSKELARMVEELKREAALIVKNVEVKEVKSEEKHIQQNGDTEMVDVETDDAEVTGKVPQTERIVRIKYYQVQRLQHSIKSLRESITKLTLEIHEQKTKMEEFRLKMEKENYELKKKMVMDDIEFARIKGNSEEFDAFLRDLEDMRLEVLEYERENVDLRSKLARVEEVVTGEPAVHNQSNRYPSPKFDISDISFDSSLGKRFPQSVAAHYAESARSAELDGNTPAPSSRLVSSYPLTVDNVAIENEQLKGKIEMLRRALFDKMEESERILQESIIISPTPPPPDTPPSLYETLTPTPTAKVYIPAKADDEIDVLVSRELPPAAEIPPNFERLEKGVYQFGTKKINMEIKNGTLVVRVGGGYMLFVEFVRKYGRIEVQKTRRAFLKKEEENKPPVRQASPEKRKVIDNTFHTPLPTPTLVRRGRELKLVPHQ